MRHTAAMFARGVSTCWAIVDQFAEAVIDVLYHEIKLPNAEDCEVIAQHFYVERGCPGCVGAMDGKHFHICAALYDDVSLKCYKGYRSVTVLALCDHNYRFTNIVLADGNYANVLLINRSCNC